NDIIAGNNDDNNLGHYSAQAGWDPCTGLGSPNGAAILAGLSSSGAMSEPRVPIHGSAPKHGSKTHWLTAAPPNEEVEVTIILRRSEGLSGASKTGEQLLSGEAPQLSREEAAQAIAADPKDMAAVHSFVQKYGLTIVEENAS